MSCNIWLGVSTAVCRKGQSPYQPAAWQPLSIFEKYSRTSKEDAMKPMQYLKREICSNVCVCVGLCVRPSRRWSLQAAVSNCQRAVIPGVHKQHGCYLLCVYVRAHLCCDAERHLVNSPTMEAPFIPTAHFSGGVIGEVVTSCGSGRFRNTEYVML